MATSVRKFPVGTRVEVSGNECTVKGYNIKGGEATKFVCTRVDNGAEVTAEADEMTKVSVAGETHDPIRGTTPPT